jgi:tetratricopeptide (TPR) repeat protein
MLSEETLLKSSHTNTHASFNKQLFEAHIDRLCASTLDAFKQIARQYAVFHIAFFILGLLELLAFVLFFSFLTRSAVFAFTLAGIFFTGFAYFILLFYFQAKKPQQLLDLRNTFIDQCQTALPFSAQEQAYHSAQIHALYQLFSASHRQEYAFYIVPSAFKTLSLLAKKFSVWTHWKDVHQFQETILLSIVKHYVHLVQQKPTDLEIHAGLASTFLSLTKLYTDPRKSAPNEPHLWVSPDYLSASMHEKFKLSAFRAIEELRILDTYAPNDPWVHAQLAAVYQSLGLIDKEIQEYEAILTLSPKDQNILFRLGVLYFSQGRNAQALHLYEKLKGLQESKAEELLSYYGAAFFDEDSAFSTLS